MISTDKKIIQREKRKFRIRKKIFGTKDCPRVSFFRSNRSIYVQVIDDAEGFTLCSAKVDGKNREAAKSVGTTLVALMKKAKYERAVFDRNGYKYHGVVSEFVEILRGNGIKI